MSKNPRDQLNEARLTISSLRLEVKELREMLEASKAASVRSSQECAIHDLEASGLWYFISKGRTREGEPIYAVQLIEPKINGAEYMIIEDENLAMCAGRALSARRMVR